MGNESNREKTPYVDPRSIRVLVNMDKDQCQRQKDLCFGKKSKGARGAAQRRFLRRFMKFGQRIYSPDLGCNELWEMVFLEKNLIFVNQVMFSEPGAQRAVVLVLKWVRLRSSMLLFTLSLIAHRSLSLSFGFVGYIMILSGLICMATPCMSRAF